MRVVEKMKKAEVKVLRGNNWKIEGELVLKERKVYVLKYDKLKIEVIQLYHNVLVAKYRGRWKMMELVTRNYWWPGVTKVVGKYVNGYDLCQRMKDRTEVSVGKFDDK